MFDTAFHDTESLLEQVAPSVLPWEQLNRIGALVQRSVRSSEAIEKYVLDLWEASETPQRLGIRLDGVDMDRLDPCRRQPARHERAAARRTRRRVAGRAART